MPEPLDRELASHLLSIGAVQLRPRDPFTWASGLRSPIYCDNRLTLSHPPIRRRIAEGFEALIAAHNLRLDVVAGTATAGIPHAAWLAERLGLPMAYVRGRAKTHGKGNQIEGHVEAGDRVVLVEDLVSTGGSSIAAVRALQEVGAEVEAVLAIFSYGLEAATDAFREAAVPLHTLTSFDALLTVASRDGAIAGSDADALRQWQADPEGWSERRVTNVE